MNQTYLSAIKTFEGFTPQAKWDYAQHSNGYGTKALYPGEAISPEEAERRFAAEIAVARDIVEKHAQGWDEGTKAALTSLTFNAGTRWISSGLGDAVRNGDIEGVRERFVQYSKAQGEVLPGLLKRRLAEVDWIGSGTEGAAPSREGRDPHRSGARGSAFGATDTDSRIEPDRRTGCHDSPADGHGPPRGGGRSPGSSDGCLARRSSTTRTERAECIGTDHAAVRPPDAGGRCRGQGRDKGWFCRFGRCPNHIVITGRPQQAV